MLALLLAAARSFALETCDVCAERFSGTVFSREDEVAGVVKHFCRRCSELSTVCYLCGIPVLREVQTLADGRTFCARDGRTVVLDDGEAARICEQVKADLERQFLRFITFPETNVTVELMDRVKIQEIYKFAGNDYTCPNMWGCTETRTNENRLSFRISLLSGLPRQVLQTTCVHEHTHAWIRENLSPGRLKRIGPDAIEGFCELVAYLFSDAQGLEAARTNILGNHYTRGQIQLFIEAERQFGFNEVVDWMRFGVDPVLLTNELARVREVQSTRPRNNAKTAFVPMVGAAMTFDQLVLQGITWSKTRPMAMINGRNFEPNDTAKVRVAGTNVEIRCVEIRKDTVVIQPVGTDVRHTLALPEP